MDTKGDRVWKVHSMIYWEPNMHACTTTHSNQITISLRRHRKAAGALVGGCC